MQPLLQLGLGACANKARFHVIDTLNDAEIDRVVDAAARMFLRTYRSESV